MLRYVTEAVHFIGLVVSLWLGLYVFSRNPKRFISLLTALTLWSISGLFLNVILALNPPPIPAYIPEWLRILLPFWREDILTREANEWLQGWSLAWAVGFWHHVTMLMRPGRLNAWRMARIVGGYLLGGAGIYIQTLSPSLFKSVEGDPLYINTLQAGPLYLFFAIALLAYTGFALINLVRSAREAPLTMPRAQFSTLAWSTFVAGIAGPIAITGSALGWQVPTFIPSLLLLVSVLFMGYGVAKYSALMDGRTIRRDFIYNAIAIGLITAIYLLAAWASVLVFSLPGTVFLFFVMLAIVTHSLVDLARGTLDQLIYRRDIQNIRADLHNLTRLASEQGQFEDTLGLALDTLCTSVRASYGLILLFDEDEAIVSAAYQYPESTNELPLKSADMIADDAIAIEPGQFEPPLDEAALLLPFYNDGEQFGAILMGRPVNGVKFSASEIDLLLYPSDQLADTILAARSREQNLNMVAGMLRSPHSSKTRAREPVSVKEIETAFRNLNDYAYLGDHPMRTLKLVRSRLNAKPVTHLDRGKAVYSVMQEALEKLKPENEPKKEPPPREWYPYLILHDAYLSDMPNRDIMSRLYISEGTFNRTRRAALRAVTRTIAEMEALS